jgi:hypothetical protein
VLLSYEVGAMQHGKYFKKRDKKQKHILVSTMVIMLAQHLAATEYDLSTQLYISLFGQALIE